MLLQTGLPLQPAAQHDALRKFVRHQAGPARWRPLAPRAVATEGLVQPETLEPAVEELKDALDGAAPPPPAGSRHNQSGLNGLLTYGTSGLDTGAFTVSSLQPIQYAVEEVPGLLSINNETLRREVVPNSFPCRLTSAPSGSSAGQRRFIVIDEAVHRLYGQHVAEYFEAHQMDVCILPLPTHEANKDFELVFQIAERLEEFKLNRRKEPIIAIGGGVCLDIAGLAANLYRRNTPVIKVPTTLMAAVDASVGIKTAVNFHGRKNKLGTYCPPLAVFVDRTFLKTLDERNLSNGAAEMLKMACIKDEPLFCLLEAYAAELLGSHFQSAAASLAIRRSIQGMLEELEPNLWEHDLTRVVDYGHAFSPEIEMAALASGDELLHGEAVNIDMAFTTQIAYARGLVTRSQRDRVFRVMRALRLPFWHPVCSLELFRKGLADTTAARDGLQRVPLMDGLGAAAFVNDISAAELASAAAVLQRVAAEQAQAQAQEQEAAACNNVVPLTTHAAAHGPPPAHAAEPAARVPASAAF